MRLVPRRDHPCRQALRAFGRRLFAALGVARLGRQSRTAAGAWQARRGAGGHGLRVVFISGEPDTPGHLYRVARFARAAAELGCDVEVLDVHDLTAAHWSDAAPAPHVAIIWRARWRRRLEEAVGAWRRRGARILFDVDDLMVDPALADAAVLDGIRSMRLRPDDIARHYAEIRRTLLLADECLAPTRPLAAALRACGRPADVAVNGFDQETHARSRTAVLRRRAEGDDGLVRIGYASGSPTHQRDFAVAADAVAAVLRARPDCRLVLFREPRRGAPLIDVREFASLVDLENRIEWRPFVPLTRLPDELARFDVNLAPLEVGNPFCEAKSELKFFEAALVDVPTIASPTEPFRAAILPGETGLLAATRAEWEAGLLRLVADRGLRQRLARQALHHVLHRHGPDGRRDRMRQILGRAAGAPRRPSEPFRVYGPDHPGTLPVVPATEVVVRTGGTRLAQVAIVIPLHNYADLVGEAMDSVVRQTLADIELVVVDDCSTDASLDVACEWLDRHAGRFTSATLLHAPVNHGLALARNAGFAVAEAPFVFPLDADNTLEPACLGMLLERLQGSMASAAHPTLQHFGESQKRKPARPWDPARLRRGNYIDAMALIRKAAWAHAGGYVKGAFVGWEDYELWCRFVEHGFWSEAVPEAVAGYRVHSDSMLRATTEPAMQQVVDAIRAAHPWLTVHVA